MTNVASTCPMELKRIVDEYFAESRNRLLDLAAFLDRVERASDGADPASEFRVVALRKAIAVLQEPGPQRVKRMQMILSDPTDEPRDHLDRKAAYGAFAGAGEGN